MPDDRKQPYDLTEEASTRKDAELTRMARQAESCDLYEGAGVDKTPSTEGNSAGENRVTTSLSEV